MRRIQTAIVVAGLLASAGGLYLTFTSSHEDNPVFVATANLIAAWAYIGSGLVAWSRRPGNRFGLLLTAVGLAWFVGALAESNESVPFTIGWTFGALFVAVFVHALLAFPRGYLETKVVYAIVGTAYALVTVGSLVTAFFDDVADDCADCPPNAFLLTESAAALDVVTAFQLVLGVPALAGAIYVLLRRWRAASPPLRQVLAPIYTTAGLSLVLLAVALGLTALSERAGELLFWILLFTFASVPVALLAGLLRTRLARAAVGGLVVELGRARAPGKLREAAMRRTLRDPSLRLAYYVPESEGFLDIHGRALELPGEGDEQVATLIERDGKPIAALVHDRSLRDDPLALDAVGAAVGLALENEWRLAELTRSEARNRALLNAIPDLMFRMSREGVYLEYKGERSDLAAPPERLIGARVHDILPPDVADQIVAGIASALETDEVVSREYQLALDGVLRDFEARIVRDGEDAVLIVRDFTERRRSQVELERLHAELQRRHRELERERDFIRTVVDSAPSLFCLVTPGGYIVRFNSTLERLSGRQDDDRVRGYAFWDVFIAPEDRERVRREFEQLAAHGVGAEHEDHWVSASGERRLVAWSTTPLEDEGGGPRYLITGMDVTDRNRQEEELRRSRARIVEAGDVARRRLERNLHDGAQQRLVSLSLGLRLARTKLESAPAEAAALLQSASEELAQALEELRELARGIHPAILTDRGLGPALEALAARLPVAVELSATDDRLPPPVEAAAYYVVSEALANVAKYADASAVAVTVARADGRAVVEVADDGVGGADPAVGSGLRGLADRVEALDGRLLVESAPGRGTRVRAEIPCG